MLDVGVHIFSKMSGENIIEQGKKFNSYFEVQYKGMRNLFYQGILTGKEAEKLSSKVGA